MGTLFYRFLSENLENYINKRQHDFGQPDFSYRDLPDEEAGKAAEEVSSILEYFILPSQLFCRLAKDAQNNCEDLNVSLEDALKGVTNSTLGFPSEKAFKGLFDEFDVASPKLGSTPSEKTKTLSKLLCRISEFPLSSFPEAGRDTFGDAYEYLMTMYAANAGKSGGEFFTPPEVGELLARITLINPENREKDRTEVKSVYDPTCGSGGLLLKFAKILGSSNVNHFYGQDKALTVYNLCRMNMILHGIPFEKFEIAHGDTLKNPSFFPSSPSDKFECVVSNPPYSLKWEGKSDPTLINDLRFESAGKLAPKNAADWAFIEHALYCLSNTGCAAIVVFPGTLYRGNAEKTIREWFVKENYVDAVIQLPPNLFYGTSISTAILVLRKNKPDNTVLFVNAEEEFEHSKNQNELKPENINRILEAVRKRENIEGRAYLADFREVESRDFDLSVKHYVILENKDEEVDINELNREIKETVQKEEELREKINSLIEGIRL